MTRETAQEPFVVPGCEDDPEQPLCPWEVGQDDHEGYYCGAGGMKTAYEQFQASVREPQNLSRKGQLVVVTGPARSGKTSLINWCAHWVKTRLTAQNMTGIIFDLTTVCSTGMTVEQRMGVVCKAVVDEVLQLRPDDSITDRILRNPDDPDTIFRLLYRVHTSTLHGAGIFIVLLPPLDPDTVQKELNCYLRVVRPGMMLMLEHSVVESVGQQDHGRHPIQLALSYLGPGEASVLVESWPGGLPAEATATSMRPAIRREALAELDGFAQHSRVNITTGNLLLMLRRVYKSRIDGTSRFPALDYVGYPEIIEAMLPVLTLRGQGTQHP